MATYYTNIRMARLAQLLESIREGREPAGEGRRGMGGFGAGRGGEADKGGFESVLTNGGLDVGAQLSPEETGAHTILCS
eukprot:552824-Rhodomonas_salina.4